MATALTLTNNSNGNNSPPNGSLRDRSVLPTSDTANSDTTIRFKRNSIIADTDLAPTVSPIVKPITPPELSPIITGTAAGAPEESIPSPRLSPSAAKRLLSAANIAAAVTINTSPNNSPTNTANEGRPSAQLARPVHHERNTSANSLPPPVIVRKPSSAPRKVSLPDFPRKTAHATPVTITCRPLPTTLPRPLLLPREEWDQQPKRGNLNRFYRSRAHTNSAPIPQMQSKRRSSIFGSKSTKQPAPAAADNNNNTNSTSATATDTPVSDWSTPLSPERLSELVHKASITGSAGLYLNEIETDESQGELSGKVPAPLSIQHSANSPDPTSDLDNNNLTNNNSNSIQYLLLSPPVKSLPSAKPIAPSVSKITEVNSPNNSNSGISTAANSGSGRSLFRRSNTVTNSIEDNDSTKKKASKSFSFDIPYNSNTGNNNLSGENNSSGSGSDSYSNSTSSGSSWSGSGSFSSSSGNGGSNIIAINNAFLLAYGQSNINNTYSADADDSNRDELEFATLALDFDFCLTGSTVKRLPHGTFSAVKSKLIRLHNLTSQYGNSGSAISRSKIDRYSVRWIAKKKDPIKTMMLLDSSTQLIIGPNSGRFTQSKFKIEFQSKEDCCFSLIHSSNKSLDLIFESAEECKKWIRVLKWVCKSDAARYKNKLRIQGQSAINNEPIPMSISGRDEIVSIINPYAESTSNISPKSNSTSTTASSNPS